MLIGAHISTVGGEKKMIEKINNFDINVIQIFVSAPRNFNDSKFNQGSAKEFAEYIRKKTKVKDIFYHAIYLINLASSNKDLVEKSKNSLISSLQVCSWMKSQGVIFHIGSSRERTFDQAKDEIADNINSILLNTPKNSTLIIETNAGQGNCVGSKFEEIEYLISKTKDKSRIGVCLDTAHSFASGYDLSNPEKLLKNFDNIIGLKYLKAIHLNDSKTDFNSNVDRHENIGKGKIGLENIKNFINQKTLKNIPFILEVPGFDNTGPDKKNIEIVKKLLR
ncbi:deoxyribonuclease IV [Candidatus Berkelbacteria bacterium CG23_combo_of_CG06-09_8_20_14_all_33_15]|uniref:Probable endonuclease 4 n=1 Tax=Candidatus Berkelbacteria bacterium CG_4_10_14_0_2_um_filter_35_9_33_12 TaxID=1974499 RepID=A0A2M7W3S9_9BACT|nr:MAG: deoxyribonuclease IV [Candidatus Berkelbacteria bacterium CG23_combo_of_CG06-09_8_20_14_all_33_15]PJA20235.1 MAG: deoxyribonuclease IV [Candidatus Berkelbacteria bacterium CG_4_10_14_0_2_um_filter_35_9_33_12]